MLHRYTCTQSTLSECFIITQESTSSIHVQHQDLGFRDRECFIDTHAHRVLHRSASSIHRRVLHRYMFSLRIQGQGMLHRYTCTQIISSECFIITQESTSSIHVQHLGFRDRECFIDTYAHKVLCWSASSFCFIVTHLSTSSLHR